MLRPKADWFASESREGLLRVPQGPLEQGRRGFMDRAGRLAIPCTFEWVQDFSRGLAPFASDLTWELLKTRGRLGL